MKCQEKIKFCEYHLRSKQMKINKINQVEKVTHQMRQR